MRTSPMNQSANYASPQHCRPNGVMMIGRHNHNKSGLTIGSNGSATPKNLTQRRFNSVNSRGS